MLQTFCRPDKTVEQSNNIVSVKHERAFHLPGKTSMIILTMVTYEWFEEWTDTTVRKRGDDYFTYKMRFANCLFDWACKHFPKLRDKVLNLKFLLSARLFLIAQRVVSIKA